MIQRQLQVDSLLQRLLLHNQKAHSTMGNKKEICIPEASLHDLQWPSESENSPQQLLLQWYGQGLENLVRFGSFPEACEFYLLPVSGKFNLFLVLNETCSRRARFRLGATTI